MNHGAVAFLDAKKIRLSDVLLRPLSIVEGTQLFGVYYPPPKTREYESVNVRHDLMLSPIPRHSWPFAAAARVDLRHEKGAFVDVARYLSEQRANILFARCTRSTHRYATLNLVIEFQDLKETFDPEADLAELAASVEERCKILKRNLKEECASSLQENNIYNRNPVGLWALKGLAYFFAQTAEGTAKSAMEFTARCTGLRSVELDDSEYFFKVTGIKRELPTLGFASADSESFHIRIALLDQGLLKRFRSIQIDYQLASSLPEASTIGLLGDLTAVLGEEWNLWRLYNKSWQISEGRETGQIRIYTEHDPKHRFDTPEDPLAIKNSLRNIAENRADLDFSNIRIGRLTTRKIFVSIKSANQFDRQAEIMVLCKELAGDIGVLPSDVFTVEDYITRSVTRRVSEAIKECSGMIQFLMANEEPASLEWLGAEFFLAGSLGIPVVRIVDPKMKAKVTFELDHASIDLEDFGANERLEAAIKTAFRELDRAMRRR